MNRWTIYSPSVGLADVVAVRQSGSFGIRVGTCATEGLRAAPKWSTEESRNSDARSSLSVAFVEQDWDGFRSDREIWADVPRGNHGPSKVILVPPDRPVTRAQRNFGAQELATLDRNELRRLCHALLLSQGVTVGGFRSFPDYDEFVVSSEYLWATRRTVVRIYESEVDSSAVCDLRSLLVDDDASDGLIVCPKGSAPGIVPSANVAVLGPNELAAQIERSPLAEWVDGKPSLAGSRLDAALTLPEAASLVDPAGIGWLPALALNELPIGLDHTDLQPQDVLEQKAFRILTSLLRFGGQRYGEARRGERLPDAVLWWQTGTGSAAMLDCKAASGGYQMAADHLLRFEKYHELLSPELAGAGRSFSYLVILSSHFPGTAGRHSFFGRQEELEERTGMKLVYMRASDLAWFAYDLEARGVQPDVRDAMPWSEVFDRGVVELDHLSAGLTEVE